ncbi:synaptotagmin-10-like [Lineus longissimus]|uniref:synaptotagmin-10-like n=1 Tax=Lineus longissimus TaxID=88925 RepID=UPI002B4E4D26
MAPDTTDTMSLHEWYKSVKATGDQVPKESGPMNQHLEVATATTEQEDIPLLYVIIILVSVSILVCGIVIYCTWRCWRAKWKDHSSVSTPDKTPPGVEVTNLKISQSVPDLSGENVPPKPKMGILSPFRFSKVVPRQTTLPTVPQRHLSFQRQLSHKLDLSNVEFSVQKVKSKGQPDLGSLKPELYRQYSEQRRQSHLYTKICGRLYFSLFYEHHIESLVVHIIKAEDLPAKDFSGTSDPYVKVYLLPDRKTKFQTKVHRKTLSPEFEEIYNFSVPYNDLPNRMLQFSLYDFDRFSRHDLIGLVLVKDLLTDTDLSQETDYCREVLCTHQEKVDLGEMMLSLCYLPTAGRLTVVIIKARNLKAMDITGSSDPYVKVSLMCQGKRIKKRKTSVKKNTLNPVYNEALVFDVPQDNVEDIALMIKVIDYDRVGSNELMGCVAVGPLFFGIGRDHWFEMLENPRKPVAEWYPLLESFLGLQSRGSVSTSTAPPYSRGKVKGCLS